MTNEQKLLEALKVAVERMQWHYENPADTYTDIPQKMTAKALRHSKTLIAEVEASQSEVEPVTPYNCGMYCLSEFECIAQGIDFAAYERGVSDCADAFGRNRK